MLSSLKRFNASLVFTLGLSAFPCVASQCGGLEGPGFDSPSVAKETFSPELVRQELDDWFAQMLNTHPKMDMAIDVAQLLMKKQQIFQQIKQPMTQLEV